MEWNGWNGDVECSGILSSWHASNAESLVTASAPAPSSHDHHAVSLYDAEMMLEVLTFGKPQPENVAAWNHSISGQTQQALSLLQRRASRSPKMYSLQSLAIRLAKRLVKDFRVLEEADMILVWHCIDVHWPAMTRSELTTLLPIACTDCSRPSQRCSFKDRLPSSDVLCTVFSFFSHCNGHLENSGDEVWKRACWTRKKLAGSGSSLPKLWKVQSQQPDYVCRQRILAWGLKEVQNSVHSCHLKSRQPYAE